MLTMNDPAAAASPLVPEDASRLAPCGQERSGSASAGSADELDRLVAQHAPQITRLVRRLLGWPGDVDDVVQDIFVAALKGLPRFNRRSALATWLTRIAINCCR